MKFNLKNRPFLTSDYNDPEKVKKWFEGFEKELRENLNDPCMPWLDVEAFIREILGDS